MAEMINAAWYQHLQNSSFLKMKRFTKMSDSHQYKIFQEFGGNTAKLRVNNKPEHCWKIAATIADTEYKLKDNDFKEEDPY